MSLYISVTVLSYMGTLGENQFLDFWLLSKQTEVRAGGYVCPLACIWSLSPAVHLIYSPWDLPLCCGPARACWISWERAQLGCGFVSLRAFRAILVKAATILVKYCSRPFPAWPRKDSTGSRKLWPPKPWHCASLRKHCIKTVTDPMRLPLK